MVELAENREQQVGGTLEGSLYVTFSWSFELVCHMTDDGCASA